MTETNIELAEKAAREQANQVAIAKQPSVAELLEQNYDEDNDFIWLVIYKTEQTRNSDGQPFDAYHCYDNNDKGRRRTVKFAKACDSTMHNKFEKSCIKVLDGNYFESNDKYKSIVVMQYEDCFEVNDKNAYDTKKTKRKLLGENDVKSKSNQTRKQILKI